LTPPSPTLYSTLSEAIFIYLLAKIIALVSCVLCHSWNTDCDNWVVRSNEVGWSGGARRLVGRVGKEEYFGSFVRVVVFLLKVLLLFDATVLLILICKVSIYCMLRGSDTQSNVFGILNIVLIGAEIIVHSKLSHIFEFKEVCGLFDNGNPVIFLRGFGIVILQTLWAIETVLIRTSIIRPAQNLLVLLLSLSICIHQIRTLGFAGNNQVRKCILASNAITIAEAIFAFLESLKLFSTTSNIKMCALLLYPPFIAFFNSLYHNRKERLFMQDPLKIKDSSLRLKSIRHLYNCYNCLDHKNQEAAFRLRYIYLDHRSGCVNPGCYCRFLSIGVPYAIDTNVALSTILSLDNSHKHTLGASLLDFEFDSATARSKNAGYSQTIFQLLKASIKSHYDLLHREAYKEGRTENVLSWQEYNIIIDGSKLRNDIFLGSTLSATISQLAKKSSLFETQLIYISFLFCENEYPALALSRLNLFSKGTLQTALKNSYIKRTLYFNYSELARKSMMCKVGNIVSESESSRKSSTLHTMNAIKQNVSLLSVFEYHNSLTDNMYMLRSVAQSKILYYQTLLESPIDYPSLTQLAGKIQHEMSEIDATLQFLFSQYKLSPILLSQICLFEQAVREHKKLSKKLKNLIFDIRCIINKNRDNAKGGGKGLLSETNDNEFSAKLSYTTKLYDQNNAIVFVRPEQNSFIIVLESARAHEVLQVNDNTPLIGMDLNTLISEDVCPKHNDLLLNFIAGKCSESSYRGKRSIRTVVKVESKVHLGKATCFKGILVYPQIEVRLDGGIHIGALIQGRASTTPALYVKGSGKIAGANLNVS